MENDANPKTNEAAPKGEIPPSPPPPTPPPSVIGGEHHDIEPPRENPTTTQTSAPPPDRIRPTDWIIAAFTIVIALATIAQGFIAYYSAQDAGKQTDKLICAANKQAAAADRFSTSAANLETTITNAETDLKNTANNSRKSIEATQDAMRIDQRAWVGIYGSTVAHFKEGEDVIVDIDLVNTGHTPALEIDYCSNVGYGPNVAPGPYLVKEFTLSPSDCKPGPSLGPTAHHIIHAQLKWKDLEPIYHFIRDKQAFLSFFGEIHYRDIFGKETPERVSQFCIWMPDTQSKELNFCDHFNDMK